MLLKKIFDFRSRRELAMVNDILYIGALKFFKYCDADIEYIDKIKAYDKATLFNAVHSE